MPPSEELPHSAPDNLSFLLLGHDLEAMQKLLTVEDSFFATYEPPEAVRNARPKPMPYYGQHITTHTEQLEEYIQTAGKESVEDLSWTERFMLSEGQVPYAPLGRLALVLFIHQTYILHVAALRDIDASESKVQVVEGLVVGKIIEVEDIPGSLSGQRIAKVHVGDRTNEDGDNTPDIRQIVCGGSNVLQTGHSVVVALPGARTQDGKKIRRRHYNIPDHKGNLMRYESDGMLCSKGEAASFSDKRNVDVDQVLILPDHPYLKPGWSLDEAEIYSLSPPYNEVVMPGPALAGLTPALGVFNCVLLDDPVMLAGTLNLARGGASEEEILTFQQQYVQAKRQKVDPGEPLMTHYFGLGDPAEE